MEEVRFAYPLTKRLEAREKVGSSAWSVRPSNRTNT